MCAVYMYGSVEGQCGDASVLQIATLGVASLGLLFSIYSRFSLSHYILPRLQAIKKDLYSLVSPALLPNSVDAEFSSVRLS